MADRGAKRTERNLGLETIRMPYIGYFSLVVLKVILYGSGGHGLFQKNDFRKVTRPRVLILFQPNIFYIFPMIILTKANYKNFEISSLNF